MKLALPGASGRTGRLVMEQALSQGHHVRALVRSPSKLGTSHRELEALTDDSLVRRGPFVAG